MTTNLNYARHDAAAAAEMLRATLDNYVTAFHAVCDAIEHDTGLSGALTDLETVRIDVTLDTAAFTDTIARLMIEVRS